MAEPSNLDSDPTDRVATLRVLDANANRAAEGLRVVEEYLRFVLDDAHLTEVCKQLRHALAAALQDIPACDRLAARDTAHDVGTHITTPQEYRRERPADVVAASFHRVQQALRCLEEYGKLAWPAAAVRFEPLRYRAYTLQGAVGITERSVRRLAAARLYVLIDGRSSADALAGLAASLIAAGVQLLQLRDKTLPDRDLVARARRLRQLTRGTPTLLIVNDRPDIAALADADGVHVGQSELTVKDARTIVGTDRLIGVSTHSLAQARQAVLDGADYVGCGPTFPSGTKAFAQYSGVELLRAVSREIRLPAFAIGGVCYDNLAQVQAAGCRRIAVSGAVLQAASPVAEAARLIAALGCVEVP